jgi:UDP-2-acetamido-2-deoxy-ribo-hexuluronate aminotransferase
MITTKKIQMVDLRGQYLKIKTEIDEGIREVIDNTAFINGPAVREFQADLEKYLNVRHVIPCANGTDALQIAMMALGLKPGDEVITGSFTYVATAEVIGLLGLTPVLVDVKPDTFDIDPDAVERHITSRTRAIVPVHLFGQCADMERLKAIADKHGLFIIEDVAQAIGADYTFSAMYTNDDELAKKMRMIAHHGQSVQYVHDVLGVNSRLDSLQAAVLKVKLKHLDAYAAARNRAADHYDRAFSGQPGLRIPVRSPHSTHVFHQYTLQLEGIDRTRLREKLAERGIASMIYYPIPLHKQKAFASDRYKPGDFPVTERLCECVLSLPMHTELDEEVLNYITKTILELI